MYTRAASHMQLLSKTEADLDIKLVRTAIQHTPF
jgi:hypothetical protein